MAGAEEIIHMSTKTCAVCDCPMDTDAIVVRVGGQAVEVCCEECAARLREACAASTAPPA